VTFLAAQTTSVHGLPRILCVLMALGWLTFLSPPLAHYLSPYILLSGIGEATLGVWLLVAGVNAEAWKAQAGIAGGYQSPRV
jgi:hypothetical protein